MPRRNPASFGRGLGWGVEEDEGRPSRKGCHFTRRKRGKPRRRHCMGCRIHLQSNFLSILHLFFNKNLTSTIIVGISNVTHVFAIGICAPDFLPPINPGSKGDIHAPSKEFNSPHPSCQKCRANFSDRRSLYRAAFLCSQRCGYYKGRRRGASSEDAGVDSRPLRRPSRI